MIMTNTEIDPRVARFTNGLRQAGIKLTHQRLEIFREVAASDRHPDAESVFRALKPRLPTMSLDTVYRTLWLLSDLGLVTTLGPRHGRVRFDANLAHHHHYVCVLCGQPSDFESPELDAIAVPDRVKQFGTVVTTHFEVRGICRNCEEKTAGGPAPDKPDPLPDERRKK